MSRSAGSNVLGRLVVTSIMACLCASALSGCSKRCKPGLMLSDGKCIGTGEGAQLSDGGIVDASESDETAKRDADIDSDEKAAEAQSGAAGRETSDKQDSGVQGVADTGAADSASPDAGAMRSAPTTLDEVCGDGIVQGKELCDPASAAVPCPTSCEVDANPCVKAVLAGDSASCTAECKHSTITALVAGDECCPAGATPATDADCAAACTSTPEVCDGRDNDCDGEADEGVRNACGGCAVLKHETGSVCSEGSGECQGEGVYECDGMDAVSCSATTRASEPEACDGIDNDCDGRVDEGVLNSCGGCAALEHDRGASCMVGSGACAGRGTYVCMGTDAVACDARARTPVAETCDGEDNDCDGSIDENAGTTWYQDCDADGYAAVGEGRDACSRPANTNGCGWTERAPTASATDCDDQNEVRHPGAAAGLPISRTGQALPPAGDDAYDLDCDGVARPEVGMSTGKIKQGQLELIDFCEDGTACVGDQPLCLASLRVQGETTCGLGYSAASGCTGTISVYFLCR